MTRHVDDLIAREYFDYHYHTRPREFKGINAVCKEIDDCDNLIWLWKIWGGRVRPFISQMSRSHFQFISEYLNDKHKILS